MTASKLPCAHCGHTLGEHNGRLDRCTVPVERGGSDDWLDDGQCPCVDFDH